MPPSIAAAGQALRQLLDRELARKIPGLVVTMRPLDKARDAASGGQVNAYLFDIEEDAGRRNAGLGSLRAPSLALTLHYIVTAYGDEDATSGVDGQAILGAVLSALNGAPRLPLGADPSQGFATIALTRLSLEDMLRLWAAFQTPYRLSVIYELSLFDGDGTP